MVDSSATPTLRESVREHLQAFVATQETSGEHLAIDILRAFQEESNLLYETQCIRDLLDQDPFQCYKDDANLKQIVQRFQRSLQVTSCHRLEKDDNYCCNEAVVRYHARATDHKTEGHGISPLTKKQKRQESSPQVLQLHFRYERQPATQDTATSIWYSIDLSKNYGPKENILTIRCWADGNKPSRLPAVSIDDDEHPDSDGDWEDIDEDEEEEETGRDKGEIAAKVSEGNNGKKSDSVAIESEPTELTDNDAKNQKEEPRDRYACFLDPDVLQSFQNDAELTAMDEATAFFTLMTFPFYQHEFDLVGFVLDSIFGYSEEASED